jgi:hypothetical protein
MPTAIQCDAINVPITDVVLAAVTRLCKMLISMSTRGPFPVRVPSGQDYFAFARADRVAGHRRCGNHRTKRVDGRERPRIVADLSGGGMPRPLEIVLWFRRPGIRAWRIVVTVLRRIVSRIVIV